MDKYLKMADVFNGEVNVSNVYGFILYTGSIYDDSTICEHAAAFDNESAVYISNAINSHDELVAEVERLRRQLHFCEASRWQLIEQINRMKRDVFEGKYQQKPYL